MSKLRYYVRCDALNIKKNNKQVRLLNNREI